MSFQTIRQKIGSPPRRLVTCPRVGGLSLGKMPPPALGHVTNALGVAGPGIRPVPAGPSDFDHIRPRPTFRRAFPFAVAADTLPTYPPLTLPAKDPARTGASPEAAEDSVGMALETMLGQAFDAP